MLNVIEPRKGSSDREAITNIASELDPVCPGVAVAICDRATFWINQGRCRVERRLTVGQYDQAWISFGSVGTARREHGYERLRKGAYSKCCVENVQDITALALLEV